MTKTAARKSKTVLVVYFGNDDLTELPSDTNYREMINRLGAYRHSDIKAIPTLLSGNKVIKLSSESVVIVDGDKWQFTPTKSKRARADIENDAFVKRAITQLDIVLRSDTDGFVFAPYYCKLSKV